MAPSLDHVVPESQGGTAAAANLRVAHRSHNELRGDLPVWLYRAGFRMGHDQAKLDRGRPGPVTAEMTAYARTLGIDADTYPDAATLIEAMATQRRLRHSPAAEFLPTGARELARLARALGRAPGALVVSEDEIAARLAELRAEAETAPASPGQLDYFSELTGESLPEGTTVAEYLAATDAAITAQREQAEVEEVWRSLDPSREADGPML